MRTCATVLLVLALAAAAAASEKTNAAPNLAGTWSLDRDASTSRDQPSKVVIRQTPAAIRFEFRQKGQAPQFQTIITDGEPQKLYQNRQEKTQTRSKYEKGKLVVYTDHFMGGVWGSQYTDGPETWWLSPDGSTLNHKQANGKLTVYRKDDPADKRH